MRDNEPLMGWEAYRKMALDMTAEGFIPIFGKFDRDLKEVTRECIIFAKSQGKEQISLLIDSGGGQMDTTSTIRACMLLSEIEFTGIVLGRAMSAAFNLLQTCHKRIALPNASLMFHWGSRTFTNSALAALNSGNMHPIESYLKEAAQVVKYISERSGLTEEKLRELATYDMHLTALDGIEMGLLDSLLENLPKNILEKADVIREHSSAEDASEKDDAD
jgi:ATP-dependent protease ClpP protease subunit